MKNISRLSLVIFLFMLYGMISCNSSPKKAALSESDAPVERIEVSIKGMSCTGCEQTIQNCVAEIEGVKSVTATFTSGKAFVDYNPGLVDTAMIKKAISQSGYKVTGFIPVSATDSVK
jgi:copper chaperone CopZ